MKTARDCLPNRILVSDIFVYHLFSLEWCGICYADENPYFSEVFFFLIQMSL